jgi:hypothetical protein
MPKLTLSSEEWAWVLLFLIDAGKKMPKHGRHKMGYNATRWDFDDLYESALSDACWYGTEIWQAVEERAKFGQWPRVKPAVAFWLEARWVAARQCAEAVVRKAKQSDSPFTVTPPSDAQGTIKRLLIDYWDERLVDDWLAENLGSYTYFDSYGSSDEDYQHYQDWLREVSAGKYVRSHE